MLMGMTAAKDRETARQLLDEAQSALFGFRIEDETEKSQARVQIALAASILAHAETLAEKGVQ
jgi:hypothetical protein